MNTKPQSTRYKVTVFYTNPFIGKLRSSDTYQIFPTLQECVSNAVSYVQTCQSEKVNIIGVTAFQEEL